MKYPLIFILGLIACSGKYQQKVDPAVRLSQLGSPKNIILILLDDYGYEIPGCNGGAYETPNIDALSNSGMRFTQCHSSPLCSPSRVALLTGQYNFRNYKQWGRLEPSSKTIANMFDDAGYKTALYGKWQLSGANEGIHNFGFDQYCAWNATGMGSDKGTRYKDPLVYAKGKETMLTDRYGEDVFTDSVLQFIHDNKDGKFFIYYAMVNTHFPFSPTPDDQGYHNWPGGQKSDTAYFPSMVKYADEKIGEIITEIKALGLDSNTIVIVTGDNGTAKRIKLNRADGGKGQCNEVGTHVPLVAWGAGISHGTDSSLICFQDFFPTLAAMARIILPASYTTIDGVSFYNRTAKRDWIYNYYNPLESKNKIVTEWVQDYNYRLTYLKGRYTLYSLPADTVIRSRNTVLTPEQKAIKKKFQDIIETIKK